MCREGRLEDSPHGLLIHSMACVRYGHQSILAGHPESMGGNELFIYDDLPCRYGEDTALRHGVPGIRGKVDEDLMLCFSWHWLDRSERNPAQYFYHLSLIAIHSPLTVLFDHWRDIMI
jgi:hypothetical protein